MSGNVPTVDILVSTFNEEAYLDRCLEHIRSQDYPRDRLRIWLIDGGSNDATVSIAREHAAADDRITVIADNVRRNLPASLNLALDRCRADLVAKIDAHGFPELDFISRAVASFEAGGSRLACVGGRPEQVGETAFGRAVARARTSRFGVGGSVYAQTGDLELVDTVQCGVYRRAPLMEVGAFDPEMNYGEDEELNWRLRKAGFDILLDASIRFHYVTRPGFRAAYRQYRNYGEARVAVIRKHPDFLRVRHLAPAALVVALGVGVLAPFSRLAGLSGGLAATTYAAATSVCAVRTAGTQPQLAPRIGAAFVALHVGYGVGTLRGLRRWIAVSMRERATRR